MNILFLTLMDFSSIEEKSIYTDLMREFVKDGHMVCIISPVERRKHQPTKLLDDGRSRILKLQIGNVQKTNMIEKGISTITLESKFLRGIKKYFGDIRFDLVIYSTPPITFQRTAAYVKRRDGAAAYLLLKDIFPQNAADLGILSRTGPAGLLYRYFRAKEKKLYAQSDYIGCMSEANADYIRKNNPEIPPGTVEVCPNSIEPEFLLRDEEKTGKIKEKYGIPKDRTIFLYGGNLGKPQGVDFIIECLRAAVADSRAYFIIAGAGTEFGKLKSFFEKERPPNASLFAQLPKSDYELLAASCDVGLIFLDRRFTIPNFPSRLLSYMQASIPVLAATDTATDIGKVIESGGFGLWCESGDTAAFLSRMGSLCDVERRKEMGEKARKHLEEHYTARQSCEIIMRHFQ